MFWIACLIAFDLIFVKGSFLIEIHRNSGTPPSIEVVRPVCKTVVGIKHARLFFIILLDLFETLL